MKIYLVCGNIYDYEGTYTWPVKAFFHLADVELFLTLLEEEHKTFMESLKEAREKIQAELSQIETPVLPPKISKKGSFATYAEIEKAIMKGKAKPEHVEDLTQWKAFVKKTAEWGEKRNEIVKKYEINRQSQYDPNMSFNQETSYEITEIELEGEIG